MSRCLYYLLIAGASLFHAPSPAADSGSGTPAAPKRRPATRPHILVEFPAGPQEKDYSELARRGAAVLEYVPPRQLLVSIEDPASLEGMEGVSVREIPAGSKISESLAPAAGVWRAATAAPLVVSFHHDVPAAEARALIAEQNLAILENSVMLPNEFLVEGGWPDAARLAEWDEVARVYTASADLAERRPVVACPGAMTVLGRVASMVRTVGEGWDGPGRHSATLGYYYGRLATRLDRAMAQAEIARALAEWSRHVEIGFVPATQAAPRTLTFLFGVRSHGDAFPFDGPGRVLAHTYYPAPENPEPIAGDLHFDDDESWGVGGAVDLYSVALHEIGHALGLGHSDRPGTVMYPYYARLSELSSDDIAAIRTLYAAKAEGGAGPKPGGPSQPPGAPEKPSQPQGSDRAAPAIFVLSPAAVSSTVFDAVVTLRGTAQDPSGIEEVTWTDSLGNGGAARGTAQWEAGPLPLRIGTNTITVRARDTVGNTAWRSVVITRRRK